MRLKKLISGVLAGLTAISSIPFSSAGVIAAAADEEKDIWDGSTDTSWYDSEETEFHISTPEELAGLAELVNDGKSMSGQTFVLDNNIYLNDVSDFENWSDTAPENSWTPIGTGSVYSFSGIFDGSGFSIEGLYISGSDYQYSGLFGYTSSSAEINNTNTTYECINNTYSHDNCAGGIVAHLNGRVSNCSTDAVSTVRTSSYAGGIVGYSNGLISNCTNNQTVTFSVYGGGIAGYSVAKINSCINNGIITSSYTYHHGGGIAGFSSAEINSCANNGDVSCTSTSSSSYVGGIVAESQSTTISNCYNKANISGYNYSGGIIGYASDTTINTSYNTSKVTGSNYVGGVVGYDYGSTLNKVYYASSNTKGVGNYSSDSAIAKSDANMKKESFATSLGEAFVYVEGDYPKLAWEVNGGEEPTETTTEETTVATTAKHTTAATTKATTNKTTVATTAAVTKKTTITEPIGDGLNFEIGKISAKAGAGYGEEGSDTEWSAVLPIMVNNDPGLASFACRITKTDDLSKIFEVESISFKDEDNKPGPYTGSFTAETKYWAYIMKNTVNRNWEIQKNGTPFMYFYIKVTPYEDLIASTAEKMGIKLESDENGSYYKFPMTWDPNYEKRHAADTNGIVYTFTETDGSIKVYVTKKAETTEPADSELNFEIGNISAKAGAGYGAEDSDTEWPVTLPIMVNNDPGLAGVSGKLVKTDDLSKIFEVESILFTDEETGKTGPYTGTFSSEKKYWAYHMANNLNGNWEIQKNGTPFMYYYIKVTSDEDLIASTASKMGIKLEKDENGSYYKFPMKWDTDYDYAVSDVNFCDFKTTLTDGSIKVYVSGKKQTTAATTKATTSKTTVATTAAITKKATTVTTTTAKAETKTTTVSSQLEFVIGNISAKAGAGYGEKGSDTEWSVMLPITVNNDPGLAGLAGQLFYTYDLSKIFEVESISTITFPQNTAKD